MVDLLPLSAFINHCLLGDIWTSYAVDLLPLSRVCPCYILIQTVYLSDAVGKGYPSICGPLETHLLGVVRNA